MRRSQTSVVYAAVILLLALAALAALQGGIRLAALSSVGFFGGFSLYRASFGFTSAWRRFLSDGRSAGVRAQLVMLSATVVVSFPLLANGTAFGQPLVGFVFPVGPALLLGAFLFGIGMQLGGGCGSGTLYTAGGGSLRMMATLAAFIVGSLIATADPLRWQEWPAVSPMSLIEALGPTRAIITTLGTIAVIYLCVARVEVRQHEQTVPLSFAWPANVLRDDWPLVIGAVALAAVNVATLLVAGRPWGITSAFAVWGAKAVGLFGVDVSSWRYWQADAALHASVLADATSVMDFGLMLGALAAAGMSGRFAPAVNFPLKSLLAAVAGGLLMGVGARMATGCNIGAFFSGIASGSLHGLVWLAAAIPGNMIGARLRPRFGLGG